MATAPISRGPFGKGGAVIAGKDITFGGIEAGGTKFVLAIGSPSGTIVERHEIATRGPEDALREALDWFRGQEGRHGPAAALGIGSFGPVDCDPRSPGWGRITTTPKPGWADCDIAGYFADRLGCPVGFDTDVNAAALAEWHARRDRPPHGLAYVTVGTGIGGGIVAGGDAIGKPAHPEIGHIRVARHADDRAFAGSCPFHGDCLEGLASGPAIRARWGLPLGELPADGPAKTVVAHYLAQLCHVLFSTAVADLVLMGGGVMKTPGLLDLVRTGMADIDRGYLPQGIDRRIERPLLGDDAGIAGALILAGRALDD
ncbi:ROK family protein [Qipengyuania sp. JC766]|uniref:ROK family protein n=1 Tax=Qipengyuania sp. JC766 TaxID=3232139 RepID=UPI00345846D6